MLQFLRIFAVDKDLVYKASTAILAAGVSNIDYIAQWLQMLAAGLAIIVSLLTSIKLVHQYLTYRKRMHDLNK